ncbi:MAG TPA: hypothetical protein VLF19_04495 [Methylomirabilota bacterium]|nr:hypothetical protein [Methylomirabilota bacterium]
MLARLILAGEFLCGGESDVSFRQRGVPFAAPAVSDEDVTWGLYALAHHDIYDWLGLTFRFALGPDGRVRGATVVELTEETYTWVKPLLDCDFTRQFVG